MNIQFAALTDVGTRKPVNQDSYLIKSIKQGKNQIHLLVLCDGMGGMQQGETASRAVVEKFRNWFDKNAAEFLSTNPYIEICLVKEVKKLLKASNTDIMLYGQAKGKRLGTTASILLIVNNKYHIVHVGDTRIYKYNNNLIQLTEDHTLANMKQKKGLLAEDKICMSKDRHVLYQCIGMHASIKIQSKKGRVKNGDTFFLCCDGMYHLFLEKNLQMYIGIMRGKDIETIKRVLRDMINMVQNEGETDNITALVADVREY